MEQIKALSEYKELLRENKQRFGSVSTNCFLMASNLQPVIEEGRLFYRVYEEGLAVFVDEGSYFNLYYFWKSQAPLGDFRQEKPVLIEELNNNGSRDAYLAAFEPLLQQAGFEKIRNNLQVEESLRDRGEAEAEACSRTRSALEEQGLTLAPCSDSRVMDQAVALWQAYLDITDIPREHLVLKRGDTVMNILDARGQIAATTWWRINGKSSESRHTVTHPDYYRKGLATALLQTWMDQTAQCGVTRWMTWISEENHRSLAAYGKMGFRTNGRTSKQYILK